MPVLEAIEAAVEIIEDSVLARPMTAADIERLGRCCPETFAAAQCRGPLSSDTNGAASPQLNQARASS